MSSTRLILPKLHKGQLHCWNTIFRDDTQYLTIAAGRRWGKTLLGHSFLTKIAMSKEKQTCLYVSRWFKQVKEAYTDYKNMFEGFSGIEHIANFTILFKNKSQIRFYSAHLEESLKGGDADAIVADEFALWSRTAWDVCLSPRMATNKNSKALIISSPKGKGAFYNRYHDGLSSPGLWKSYQAPSSDNPLVSRKFLEDKKRMMSLNFYKQEYEAEFQNDTGILFENIDNCIVDIPKLSSNQLYAGIDLGYEHDFTVITIIDENHNMIHYERFNKETGITLNQLPIRLTNILREYNWPITYIEDNQYQGVFEMMKNAGAENIYTFNTNTSTKKSMIENLISLISAGQITILNDKYYVSEFYSYEFNYNEKTRNISYSSPSGLHDDCVMSLALAVMSVEDNNKSFFYSTSRERN